MTTTRSPLRALLSPGAWVSHVLVLLVVVGCVAAGQWQFQRLDERRTSNERLEERRVAEPVEVATLFGGGDDVVVPTTAPADLEFRRVTATGTYLPEQELVLEGRSFGGQTGRDVFTPLELEDGSLVLVRRGWVPREAGPPPVQDATPPEGEVTIEGYLEVSVDPPSIGPQNPQTGELSVLQIPDVPRIAEQFDAPMFAMPVRLTDQRPPQVAADAVAAAGIDALPAIPPVEPLDERNHLSYAVQWYSFAVLALIAYSAWWVKRLREERDGPDDTGVAPDARRGASTPSGSAV